MQRVSVIVPVHNVEPYLDRCIRSLVSQSYANIEILLINDGSTDLSGNICEKWARDYSNIVVIEQDNHGVSAARNAGLEQASGDYIMFVDSDDWCEPNMVETMVQAINGHDFAYCSYYLDTDTERKQIKNAIPSGKYLIKEIHRALFFGIKNTAGADMATALWRGIFKATPIKANNIKFDTYIRFAEDWLFMQNILST